MKKILIVEDDPILRGIYRRKFDLSGFVVEAVDDGPAALEVLPTFNPNLIQMDLSLPSMNGTELIRQIRAMPNFKIVPIVVLSSFYRSRFDQAGLRRRRQQVRFQNGLHPQSGPGNCRTNFQRRNPRTLSSTPGKLRHSRQHAAAQARRHHSIGAGRPGSSASASRFAGSVALSLHSPLAALPETGHSAFPAEIRALPRRRAGKNFLRHADLIKMPAWRPPDRGFLPPRRRR